MKKLFFFAALAAAVSLTSCSDDDDIISSSSTTVSNLQTDANAFTTGNGLATRAGTYGEAISSLSKFYATAITTDNTTYFENVPFSLDGSVFSSATPYYWPTSNKLSFAATNVNATWGRSAVKENSPSISYTTVGKTDIVVATSNEASKAETIPLSFSHVTVSCGFACQVDPDAADCKYIVKDFRIKAANTGVLNVDMKSAANSTWSSVSGSQTLTLAEDGWFPYTIAANSLSEFFPGEQFFILPGSQITVELEYQIYKNGVLICDRTGENYGDCTITVPASKMGYAMVYDIYMTMDVDEPIQFTSKVLNWGSTSEVSGGWL